MSLFKKNSEDHAWPMIEALLPSTPDIQNKSISSGEAKKMATVIEYDRQGMSADKRCDRCGGQAYAEVLLHSGHELLFCAHDLKKNWDKLMEVADTIADHSKFLRNQEHQPV